MKRSAVALLFVAGSLVTACSPLARRAVEDPAAVRAYEARHAALAAIDRWEITGRLAITDGAEGGSGALNWVQQPHSTRMSFRGALGQGHWELESNPQGAILRLADGSVYQAPDVAALVAAHVGWNVPVDALAWWVRGLAAGDSWDERRLDEAGRMQRLRESGWVVDFDRYRDDEGTAVPSRLTARHGDYAVKLVVREWRLGGTEPHQ